MIDHFHGSLKSVIIAHGNKDWTNNLPAELLGLRMAWKENLGCLSADLVFDARVRSAKRPVFGLVDRLTISQERHLTNLGRRYNTPEYYVSIEVQNFTSDMPTLTSSRRPTAAGNLRPSRSPLWRRNSPQLAFQFPHKRWHRSRGPRCSGVFLELKFGSRRRRGFPAHILDFIAAPDATPGRSCASLAVKIKIVSARRAGADV
ncbi:hypothetical protein EVAR_56978_1 [Eumeta japonica]|uniref:Uncharacterized protein n=1 Tax=Eumeta variegata TaxID=151549 RepID=A0A4C1ZAY2_EUMVA|nr:hypothetical protein EVAR_56978_1 [Eumeta japonica]